MHSPTRPHHEDARRETTTISGHFSHSLKLALCFRAASSESDNTLMPSAVNPSRCWVVSGAGSVALVEATCTACNALSRCAPLRSARFREICLQKLFEHRRRAPILDRVPDGPVGCGRGRRRCRCRRAFLLQLVTTRQCGGDVRTVRIFDGILLEDRGVVRLLDRVPDDLICRRRWRRLSSRDLLPQVIPALSRVRDVRARRIFTTNSSKIAGSRDPLIAAQTMSSAAGGGGACVAAICFFSSSLRLGRP